MLPRSLTVYSRARDPGEPPPALPASLSSRTTSHPAMEVPTGAPLSWASRAGGGSPADEPIGHDGRRRGGGRRREWKGEKRAARVGARRSRSSSRDRRCMQMDDVGACPWEASSARARVRSRRKTTERFKTWDGRAAFGPCGILSSPEASHLHRPSSSSQGRGVGSPTSTGTRLTRISSVATRGSARCLPWSASRWGRRRRTGTSGRAPICGTTYTPGG